MSGPPSKFAHAAFRWSLVQWFADEEPPEPLPALVSTSSPEPPDAPLEVAEDELPLAPVSDSPPPQAVSENAAAAISEAAATVRVRRRAAVRDMEFPKGRLMC